MKVKIMTSIYSDLYGTELGGRTGRRDHYRFSLLSLLKMSQADFVCYTSEREIEDLKEFFYKNHNISEERLKFVLFDLSQNEYAELIRGVKNFDTIRTSDRCYDIQYSKFSWFKNEDKTYDYYFWFDAGLSHCGLIPDKYLPEVGVMRCYYESNLFNDDFLTNLINYAEDKFVVVAKENSRNYWEGTVDPKFYQVYDNSVHIIGGFFGGKTELWDKVVKQFDDDIRVILPEQNKLFYEEHYMSLMYQNHKDWFKGLNFDIWWHENNFKEGTEEFFSKNKSFYKILEELNNIYE
jgi:hypothetical protein